MKVICENVYSRAGMRECDCDGSMRNGKEKQCVTMILLNELVDIHSRQATLFHRALNDLYDAL